MGTSTSFIPAEQETIVDNNNYGYTVQNAQPGTFLTTQQNAGRTTVRTIDRPARTIVTDYSYTLRLQEIDGNVVVIANASGGREARKYVARFLKELQFRGVSYAVVK